MSGKRVLDFIALTQALTAVARKSVRLQELNTPIVGRATQDAHTPASDKSLKTEETFNSASISHREVPSTSQDAPSGLVQPKSPILYEANSKVGTRRDDRSVVDAKNISERHQTSPILSDLNAASKTSELPTAGSHVVADVGSSQPQEERGDKATKAESAAFPEQDLGPLYSELFRSPRSANLFRAKANRPSAWANIEFHTPPKSVPHGLSETEHPAIAENSTHGDISASAVPDSPVPRPSTPLQARPISQEADGEPLKSEEIIDANRSDLPIAATRESVVEKKPASSPAQKYELRESKVPSTRLGRIWQYGGLATSLAFGAAGEGLRRSFGGNRQDGRSLLLSDSNMEAIVSKLSRMRGAALKLGQMISFQDLKMLPGPIYEVLQRVQDSADFMPAWQRNKVLESSLGSDWRDLFSDFEEKPLAAASIGQVHAATLKSTGKPVAVKIQYPGVANSIDSDLNNLALLLTASRLLPKGLYLDKTIANARTELAWECDYVREGEAARHFANLLSDDQATFTVPEFIESASAPQVLTLERMYGVAVTKIPGLSQDERDWIATNILRLCLRELFEFRYMQTDPNWTNFLYNQDSKKLELLDFGASREYPATFTDPYCNILLSAAKGDRKAIGDLSVQLGYLTGHESRTMLDAHVDSVLTLAEPFSNSSPDVYDFRDQTITDRVRAFIPVMLRERLAPPPEETYSLHRKLSGAFLLCARLEGRVAAKDLFNSAVHKWKPVAA